MLSANAPPQSRGGEGYLGRWGLLLVLQILMVGITTAITKGRKTWNKQADNGSKTVRQSRKWGSHGNQQNPLLGTTLS